LASATIFSALGGLCDAAILHAETAVHNRGRAKNPPCYDSRPAALRLKPVLCRPACGFLCAFAMKILEKDNK